MNDAAAAAIVIVGFFALVGWLAYLINRDE